MHSTRSCAAKGLEKKNLLRLSELPDVSSHEEFTEQDLAALRSKVSNFLVGKSLGEDLVCELCPRKSVSFGGKKIHSRLFSEWPDIVSADTVAKESFREWILFNFLLWAEEKERPQMLLIFRSKV